MSDDSPFSPQHQEEERARCEWDFRLSAAVSPANNTTMSASDAIGAIDFDPTDRLLATGGISRKIRFYSTSFLSSPPEYPDHPLLTSHSAACDFYICAPAKLSSLRWRPDAAGRLIASGDYDGVVTEYDLESRAATFERDEHGGRRVWSVAYSLWSPHVGASGSDDGTVQLWDTRGGGGVIAAAVNLGRPVCSVEFDPDGGPGIGVGCADRKAYVYDARAVAAGPVAEFGGHGRTVTYVRFAGGGRVVSSGTDGAHRMWGVEDGREVRVYRGHVNRRSFVGMAVWGGGGIGLIGCGSESNEVFVYDLRWGEPVWVRKFWRPAVAVAEEEEDGRGFVSAVCWREAAAAEECTLVAGGSNGALQVFSGKRRPLLG